MFNYDWLDTPISYSKEIEACFNYSEVSIYNKPTKGFYRILENGYAESTFIEPVKWTPGLGNVEVTEIDIIFTKYPFHREDWITNYSSLLADRLKKLFEVDPSLNQSNIKYNIIIQTACKTEKEAMKLFHGIVIKFRLVDIVAKRNSERELQKIQEDPIEDREQYRPQYSSQPYEYTPPPRRKYPEKKKKKSKRKVKQKCPDFKIR